LKETTACLTDGEGWLYLAAVFDLAMRKPDAGKSPGKARQGPPTRRWQAIALTTGKTGVTLWVSLLQPPRHLLDRTGRYHLLQARPVACPMRFGPHLCSHPPGQTDTRDLPRVEMGSRRKQVTQTGSEPLSGNGARNIFHCQLS
jgi:hypothetical protein